MAKNRIMMVENDKEILGDIVFKLKQSGYDCAIFPDDQKVAASLEEDSSYDLILLNIDLPNGFGFELLAHMTMSVYNIPVICLTAQSDTASEVRALNAGAEDCVVKPFDFQILHTRMRKILDRRGKLDTVVRVEDVVIDLANRAVNKNGREVLLNPKEFGTLSMLICNKNQTLSRQRILDEVWGADYFGSTHTVDVKISNLRKKLGFQKIIRTVSKSGYRLEDE